MRQYQSTEDYIRTMKVPEMTRTYKPIYHGQVIDLIRESSLRAGLRIKEEKFASAKDADVVYGRHIFDEGDSEMNLQIVWTNSYDKSKKLSVALSSIVLVCGNGMISSRNVHHFSKKHVGEIQTYAPAEMTEYVNRAEEIFSSLQVERERMKQIEVDQRTTSELVGRIYMEHEFLSPNNLSVLKKEIEHPTHDYKALGSLWSLYNAITFSIGGIHPSHWLQDHLDAHEFFVNVAGELERRPFYAEFDPEAFNEEVNKEGVKQLSWLDEIYNKEEV